MMKSHKIFIDPSWAKVRPGSLRPFLRNEFTTSVSAPLDEDKNPKDVLYLTQRILSKPCENIMYKYSIFLYILHFLLR